MNQSFAVHASLPATTVWVDSTVFHNLESPSQWVKAKLFGLTCLTGRVPTFEILTAQGYVFSEVPPHLIRWRESTDPDEALSLESLVYNNCLSETFSLSVFDELRSRKAFAYFKREGRYLDAEYWFSLDFYRDNNWFHCMKLSNGQFAFTPSHKLVFPQDGVLPDNHAFPAYQKLRYAFSV